MSHLEIEVKFLVPNLAVARSAILAAGGVLHRARVFERNVRYDTVEGSLRQRIALLRLRDDGQARLTFKGMPPDAPEHDQTQARVREELEVVVSDFAIMEMILQRLGYTPQQRYEKYRETFQLGEVEVVLDELPFGNFVELEGPADKLPETAAVLGLSWERRILLNYLALLDELKAQVALPFDDLTFDNFAGRHISLGDLAPWR